MSDWICEVLLKMKKNRITQKELCKETGFTEQYVSMILNEKKESEKARVKICTAVDSIITKRSA